MDELTTAQRSELEIELNKLVEQLVTSLDTSAESAKPVELDQTTMGRVSRIDAIQQQKMIEAARRGHELRLRQARAALQRIADDEFGECLMCDEPIGYRRLSARPESPFCLECQSRKERR